MLWDNENLYFLIAVDDPDIGSTMTIRDRDCLCREETIEIFIDADGDTKDYAEIHINCLNTINDIWIPKNDFKFHDGSPGFGNAFRAGGRSRPDLVLEGSPFL